MKMGKRSRRQKMALPSYALTSELRGRVRTLLHSLPPSDEKCRLFGFVSESRSLIPRYIIEDAQLLYKSETGTDFLLPELTEHTPKEKQLEIKPVRYNPFDLSGLSKVEREKAIRRSNKRYDKLLGGEFLVKADYSFPRYLSITEIFGTAFTLMAFFAFLAYAREKEVSVIVMHGAGGFIFGMVVDIGLFLTRGMLGKRKRE